ncbi:MAG TPA: hypothetical protein VF516_02435 [Kofleriaceae bacterium]
MQTFGDHFLQFAQSVDIVPANIYDEALGIVDEHLKAELQASTFVIAIASLSGTTPQLHVDWPKGGWWNHQPIMRHGSYQGQAAFAYATGKPLWIVAKKRQALSAAGKFEDLLGNVDGAQIPRYARIPRHRGTKTSIILPLRLNDHDLFGVMNIEIPKYLAYSAAWHAELTKIATAIGILYRLTKINELQNRGTLNAKKELTRATFVRVAARRTMFVASSARADPNVMKILNETLATYAPHFEIVSWTDPQAGNILENIWSKISSCTFAACYFSEPTHAPTSDARPSSRANRQVEYRDNPNVLFEAGMLYALLEIGRAPVKKLLLVREENSPDIPFDLGAEFMILVRRLQNGNVNVSDLKKRVRATVKAILEDERA